MNVCARAAVEVAARKLTSSTVKLIFTFLISYPLAGVLKRLPDAQPWKKNVFLIGLVGRARTRSA